MFKSEESLPPTEEDPEGNIKIGYPEDEEIIVEINDKDSKEKKGKESESAE